MKTKTSITICLGSACYRRGNQLVLETIKQYLNDNDLNDEVEFKGHLCESSCAKGPNFQINDKLFSGIDQNSVVEILDKHFK